MGILLDAIIVAIIVLCVWASARKGFVRTFIELAGYILSIIVAINIGGMIANYTYNNWIQPVVVEAIEQNIANSGNGAVEKIPDSLVSLLNLAGADIDSLSQTVNKTANTTAVTVTDSVVKPITEGLISGLAVIVISTILFIVVGFLAKFLNSLFKGFLLGTANKALGGVLGLAKGLTFSLIFCLLVNLCVNILNTNFLIFNSDSLNSSYICRYILEFIPFI